MRSDKVRLFNLLFLLCISLTSCGGSSSKTKGAEVQVTLSFIEGIERREYLNSWAQSDPRTSGVEGMALGSVRELAIIPPPRQEIVVAVIDTGVDIQHPELKNKIWTDPQTGFHGWNFLGNAHGASLVDSNLEVAREVRRFSKISETRQLTPQESSNFLKVQKHLELLVLHEQKMLSFFQESLLGHGQNPPESLLSLILKTEKNLAIRLNPEFDPSSVIGDDPDQIDENSYGNSDVLGGDGKHGTHVAGIIAQNSDAVKIMAIRAAPQGDERDKDVIHAIEFAVDHGARIINLSIGKYYSPHREKVWKALQKAEAHNVLIVSSSGNDGKNTDEEEHFPDRNFRDPETGVVHTLSNWLVVSASSRSKDSSFVPSFNNYGKTSVDLFAPGYQIPSLLPGGEYGVMSGTSMAAPQVAGAAAFLWSRFPELHATEVKDLLLRGVRRYPGLLVEKPEPANQMSGEEQWIPFCELSVSCGVLDLRASMELALDSKKAQLGGVSLAP